VHSTAAILGWDAVEDVYVVCGSEFRIPSLAAAEPVAAELDRLVAAGKRLTFVATHYREIELYLASRCTRRSIHPLGSVALLGIGADFLFFRRFLDRARISVEVVRREEYKGAADGLVREHLDTRQRDQYRRYVATAEAALERELRRGFQKTEHDIRVLRDSVLSAQEALSSGWVDAVGTWNDIKAELESPTSDTPNSSLELPPRQPQRNAESPGEGRNDRQKEKRIPRFRGHVGRGKKIVVLTLEGLLQDGRTRRGGPVGQSVGSDSFVPEIRKTRRDRSVSGVVLRVSSRGGSATAAEGIRSELARLAAEKPLVVSIGPVAASGGYWITCLGRRLFCQESSLVGSIGVIAALAHTGGIFSRVGIARERVEESGSTNRLSPYAPVDGRTRRVLKDLVEPVYDRFVSLVADSRGFTEHETRDLAGGRIFAGTEAAERGLVDAIGGLGDAIEAVRTEIDAKRVRIEFRPRVRRSLLGRLIGRSLPSVTAGLSDVENLVGGGAGIVTLLDGRPLAVMDLNFAGANS
jgi:protease-4